LDTVGDDTDTTFERKAAEETKMIMEWTRRAFGYSGSTEQNGTNKDVVPVDENSDDYEDTDSSLEFEDEASNLEAELSQASDSGEDCDQELVDRVHECLSRLSYNQRYSLERTLAHYLWVLEERAVAEAEVERITNRLEEREGRRAQRRNPLKRYRDRGYRAGYHADQHPQSDTFVY
jgi:hypothetical protein